MSRLFQSRTPAQKVAVAAPAGAVRAEDLEAGLAVLRAALPEVEIRVDREVRDKRGYLAGSDPDRAAHLASLCLDREVGAVVCARGGYGSSRLLPLLDIPALVEAGCLLVGFSDVTCLLNALAAAGLVTVHGPVITQLPRLDPASLAAMGKLLSGGNPWPLTLPGLCIAGGRAEGPLYGGNLSLLCHLMGTPWFPPLTGAVLFIEEVGESAYRLDRLLTQLELAGVWRRVAGVAVGQVSGRPEEHGFLEEAVIRRLAGQGVPVVMDLPFGHGEQNLPLPLGARAVLDGEQAALTVGTNLA